MSNDTEFNPNGKGAVISPCGKYRYALWRVWSPNRPLLMVIGVNPSTADALRDDPTIIKCCGFAHNWDCGGLLMGNFYAWRATDPRELRVAPDPVGPDCDLWLGRMRDRAAIHLAAWGNHGSDLADGRAAQVLDMFPTLYVLGFTQGGNPVHPLARGKSFVPLTQERALFAR